MAGFSYDLTRKLALDLNYRYLNLGDTVSGHTTINNQYLLRRHHRPRDPGRLALHDQLSLPVIRRPRAPDQEGCRDAAGARLCRVSRYGQSGSPWPDGRGLQAALRFLTLDIAAADRRRSRPVSRDRLERTASAGGFRSERPTDPPRQTARRRSRRGAMATYCCQELIDLTARRPMRLRSSPWPAMPTTSVPKMIGTTTDLIIRRKTVESGLSVDADVGRQPSEQDARAHPDEDPPGEREVAEQRGASAGRPARRPWLRSRRGVTRRRRRTWRPRRPRAPG